MTLDTAGTVLMVLNGDPDQLRHHVKPERYEFMLAIDGALDSLRALDIMPDAVTGDFDSVSEEALSWARQRDVHVDHRPEQDTTDVEKGLNYLREREYGRVDVAGAGGTRLDHRLAGLETLARHADRMRLRLLDRVAVGHFLAGPDELRLPGMVDHTCSVLPLFPAEGVTMEGFRWPLRDQDMGAGLVGSYSNEITGDPAKVSLEQGCVLVYVHLRPGKPA